MLGTISTIVMLGEQKKGGDGDKLAERFAIEWSRVLRRGIFAKGLRAGEQPRLPGDVPTSMAECIASGLVSPSDTPLILLLAAAPYSSFFDRGNLATAIPLLQRELGFRFLSWGFCFWCSFGPMRRYSPSPAGSLSVLMCAMYLGCVCPFGPWRRCSRDSRRISRASHATGSRWALVRASPTPATRSSSVGAETSPMYDAAAPMG